MLVGTKSELANERVISCKKGLEAKEKIGERCVYFCEVTSYENKSPAILDLLEKGIVPYAWDNAS